MSLEVFGNDFFFTLFISLVDYIFIVKFDCFLAFPLEIVSEVIILVFKAKLMLDREVIYILGFFSYWVTVIFLRLGLLSEVNLRHSSSEITMDEFRKSVKTFKRIFNLFSNIIDLCCADLHLWIHIFKSRTTSEGIRMSGLILLLLRVMLKWDRISEYSVRFFIC